jgi:D-tyrosyl-tRNA(Tyr) deacylase
MRAVVTRVASASVTVDGAVVGAIGRGLLVLVGVAPEDSAETVVRMAKKLVSLRIFADSAGKMNLDVRAVGGSCLLVSQFTLFGDTSRGNRPSFVGAAGPEVASERYDALCAQVAALGVPVGRGVFRADMAVASVNDGPVTLIVEQA